MNRDQILNEIKRPGGILPVDPLTVRVLYEEVERLTGEVHTLRNFLNGILHTAQTALFAGAPSSHEQSVGGDNERHR